jgi:hypothetical protein
MAHKHKISDTLDKRADTCHHSVPCPFAGRVDIAIIGVTNELMAAPL